MARIAECKRCGIQFFDEKDNRINCNRCTREVREKKNQLAKLKRKWRGKQTAFDTNWAVIQLVWREKLRTHEVAEVLGISESDVEMHISIAKQNAR